MNTVKSNSYLYILTYLHIGKAKDLSRFPKILIFQITLPERNMSFKYLSVSFKYSSISFSFPICQSAFGYVCL